MIYGEVLAGPLNSRYLINEKGALEEAAGFPITVERLSARVTGVWRALADGGHAAGLEELRSIELDLRALLNHVAEADCTG